MSMLKISRYALVLGVTVFAISTGFIVVSLASAPVQKPPQFETLTVAAPVVVSVGLHWIAEAKGFWADEGLEIHFIPTVHGKAAMEMATKKLTDLAWTADTPFVISAMRGEPIQMVTTAGIGRRFTTIVARSDLGIRTPQDLIGRRLAVTENTSGDYFLWTFLIRNKIKPSTVTTVNMPPDKMAEQLANGQVDAISVWEPFREQATVKLGKNALLMETSDAYVFTQLILGNPDLLHAKSTAIERYLRGLVRAERFAEQNPEECMGVIARRVGIPVEKLRRDWPDFDYGLSITQSQLITLEANQRWAKQKKLFDDDRSTNLLPYIDLRPMLNVAPQAVTLFH